MNIGQLRHRVMLEAPPDPEDLDGLGQPIGPWTTVGTFWAFVRPMSGHELRVAEQLRADVSHLVTMRWLGVSYAIDPTMRLLFRGRVLDIVDVIDVDERLRTLTLTCNEPNIANPDQVRTSIG